jgi:hypothetical protein
MSIQHDREETNFEDRASVSFSRLFMYIAFILDKKIKYQHGTANGKTLSNHVDGTGMLS